MILCRFQQLCLIWMALCWAYEQIMQQFAVLLSRNPGLRPMCDAIAAQLRKGTMSTGDPRSE
jgi:hypothetical protein